MGEIDLIVNIHLNGHLIDGVFRNCLKKGSYEEMRDQAILVSLNKYVYKINAEIIQKLPGEYKIYQRYDSVKNQPEEALQVTIQMAHFTTDFTTNYSQFHRHSSFVTSRVKA